MADPYYYPTPPSSFYPQPPQPLPPLNYNYYAPPPPPIPGVAAHPLPPPYHHQQPLPHHYPLLHHHQPLPPSMEPSHDQLRTLFIAGLPDDVKAREIYSLFREFPGFHSSQLRSAGSTRAYAFAVFTDQQSAVAAMQSMNGLVFDLEKESTLFIDLAKSNSRAKRSRTDNDSSNSPDKKIRGTVGYSRSFLDSGVGSNIHMPGMSNSAYSVTGYPSTQSQTFYDYGTTNPNKSNDSATDYIPQNNSPCSTLFVANLGPTCSEQELTEVFSRCPGFVKLKMQKKNGLPVAFVDFKDVASSTGALKYLQGTRTHSSIGEGMRLEYAKSPMGQRGREKKT